MVMQAFGVVLLKYLNPVLRSEHSEEEELFRKSTTTQSHPQDSNMYWNAY